jgi:hypothetical protein
MRSLVLEATARQRPRPPRTLETRRHPVIERDAAGTKLTERMWISGPLGGLIGRVVRRRLAALFVAMTEQIARQAEAHSHSRARAPPSKRIPLVLRWVTSTEILDSALV